MNGSTKYTFDSTYAQIETRGNTPGKTNVYLFFP